MSLFSKVLIKGIEFSSCFFHVSILCRIYHDHEADDLGDHGLQLDNMEKQAIASSWVCPYVIPKINFEAWEYPDLIDWESEKLSEHPLSMSLTDEQLTAIKGSPLRVPDYPCHSQAVERAVCLVSETSASVIGQDARDGFIRQRILVSNRIEDACNQKGFLFSARKLAKIDFPLDPCLFVIVNKSVPSQFFLFLFSHEIACPPSLSEWTFQFLSLSLVWN